MEDKDLEVAKNVFKAIKGEEIREAATGESSFDVKSMITPGTMIWNDPSSGEERYTKPSERLYSTATMLAHAYIDKNGNRKELKS